MQDDVKLATMQVMQQGLVHVNSCVVYCESDKIVVLKIDTKSKYVIVAGSGGGDSEAPMITITFDENTRDLEEGNDPLTTVAFTDYVGWNVECVETTGRYTVTVVLCKGHNSANRAPLQRGMDNTELQVAWERKLPGVSPTERELSAFAVGVEVGFERARDLERQDWSRVHHVLAKHGAHPGRTDEHLADIIDRALEHPKALT